MLNGCRVVGATMPHGSRSSALDNSLQALQRLQDTAEQSWRTYQEGERRLFPQPEDGVAGGSPGSTESRPLPGEALLTPPTKAPGEAEALQLQLSALQRKLAEVWRQDLSGPSSGAAPHRLHASRPTSGQAPTALPPASLKSPNRLQSPFRLGAGAPLPSPP